MKEFKVKFTQEYEVKVKLDEKVYNEEYLEHYSKYFHPVDDLEELVTDIAKQAAIYDDDSIEGLGSIELHNRGLHYLPEERRNEATIVINVVSEEVYDEEIEEIDIKEGEEENEN